MSNDQTTKTPPFISGLEAWFKGNSANLYLAATRPNDFTGWVNIEVAMVARENNLYPSWIYTNSANPPAASLLADYVDLSDPPKAVLYQTDTAPLTADKAWLIGNASSAIQQLYHTKPIVTGLVNFEETKVHVAGKYYAVIMARPLEETFSSMLTEMNLKVTDSLANEEFVLNIVQIPTSNC